MRWRLAEVKVGVVADETVSLEAGEAEGFAATTAATAADDGEAVGEGFGEAAGVGDARSQLTKPELGEDAFSRFAFGFPTVGSYRIMRSTSLSRAFSVYCGSSRPT